MLLHIGNNLLLATFNVINYMFTLADYKLSHMQIWMQKLLSLQKHIIS